jgi:hypothetical protein
MLTQARAQQRAVGTNNNALFDIVRSGYGARLICEPRLRTLVSPASAARPGTKGDTTDRSRRPYCAVRFLRWVPDLVPRAQGARTALARDKRPAALMRGSLY